ncbi:PREDICTED: tyrosine-protein phosphatase non-receptor type substrate 1-like isoform X2 [Gavialis gangeticus]|uniref:tyrosine-protein phosphatase non-receptor type substrate 1-like isoform X2 n=1 Tax=Gavialis gangeticus TaxID=94835 RepID=UPI00092EF33F|nr:PREDICTED: tyrosine-protein phosphatase non-receptor type substrate 1-like isoform X2 [Gavialis gangeticus]
MAALAPGPGWCLPALVVLLLVDIPGTGGQNSVSVSVGATLVLNCTMPLDAPVGLVEWFKGKGRDRQPISEETQSLPRVTRVAVSSPVDYSICISDICPEDAGTYYCVKFRRGLYSEMMEYLSGPYTVVSVHDPASASGPWLLSNPKFWLGAALEKVLMAVLLFLLFFFLLRRRTNNS